MKLKLFVTLFSGGIAYIIVVLSGLLMHLSLNRVLMRGIIAFIGAGTGSWIILFLMEVLANNGDKKDNNDNENPEKGSEDNRETQKTNNEEQEENFSPLNPPVLEVNNEEQE